MVCAMRKFIWPVVLVVVIALLIGAGVLLSRQPKEGLKAGTLLSETASEALVGRTTEVRVPWGRLQVTISEPLAESSDGKRAGEGSSLIGVQVSLGGSEDLLVADHLPGATFSDPTFTLVADDKEYVLDGLTGWVEGDEIAQVARRQYVAVKGEPDRVSLRVGYDGVDQVVDGLTADLDRDAAESLYSLDFAGGPQTCGDPLWSTGAADVGDNVTTCVVTSSAQRPYIAGLGWAPEGKRWMIVTVLPGAPSEFDGPLGTYEVAQAKSSYLLDSQAPETTFALNDALPEGATKDKNDPQVAVFEVEQDRQTGQFEVRTKLAGEIEVTTGKGKTKKTRTKTFDALVAQGAFL